MTNVTVAGLVAAVTSPMGTVVPLIMLGMMVAFTIVVVLEAVWDSMPMPELPRQYSMESWGEVLTECEDISVQAAVEAWYSTSEVKAAVLGNQQRAVVKAVLNTPRPSRRKRLTVRPMPVQMPPRAYNPWKQRLRLAGNGPYQAIPVVY